jgi:hypothetical protein
MKIYKNRKWSAEERHRHGNVITGDFITQTDIKTREQFAIGQNNYVTCGMFVEASSADVRKKKARMSLPAIPVFDAKNFSSDLQYANTAMSPAEHSR